MSQERDVDQSVRVSRGDLTVEKSFEPEEFPVPAITFDIRSTAPEPIDVRLVDQIPEEFPMSAIGFHPDFESDNWNAYKDHRVVFERTFDPGEELRTVYGVRLDRTEDATAFLGKPTLEGVGEVDESVADVLGENRNQAVRDVLAGDRDSLVEEHAETDEPDAATGTDEQSMADDDRELELEPDEDGASPEPRARAEDATPVVREATTETPSKRPPGASDTDTTTETETAETESEREVETETQSTDVTDVADQGSVAATLAAEIRAGEVDDDDMELLREELDLGKIPPSVDVRIRRLQQTVSDLDAYADALQEFIDEEGTAEELLDSFRGDVAALSDAVAELDSELDATDADVDDLESILEDVSDELSEVAEDADRATAEVDALRDDLDEDLEALEADLESATENLEATLAADLEALREDVDQTAEEVREDLDQTVKEVREDVDQTAEEVREDLDDTHDRLDALEEDVEEFVAFRERLEQAFGGMGGVGGPEE